MSGKATRESRGPGAAGGKFILLVDDEAIIAMDESRQLERAGYSVTIATSGEEAVELTDSGGPFDLALMDINLGSGMDGTRAATKILAGHDLPIIFLSSHTEAEMVRRSEGITNYGYVVKSSSFAVLEASIKMAFKLFEAHRALTKKSMAMEALNEELRTTMERLEEAEDLARRKQIFLRTLIDNIPDAVYFSDAEGRKIIANRADLEIIGAAEESEVIGKTDMELFPGGIGARGHRDNLDVIGERRPLINREEEFIRPDGDRRWLLTSKLPLSDETGKVIGLVGIGRDITERKLAQDRAEEERILLRTLIDVLPDPIYIKDTEGRKVISNVAHYKKLDINDVNNEIGKTDLELFPGSIGERGYGDDMDVLRKGMSIIDREEDFPQPDGKVICLSTSKVPLRNARGEIVGLVGIGHDITESKALEESLKRSVEEKTFLMRELEHRVKNSFAMVSALLGLESGKVDDPASREVIDSTQRRIEAFAAVYERLYLSKDLASVEVKPYLQTLVDGFSEGLLGPSAPRIETSLCDIDLSPAKALPLGLILNELLMNAFKHAYPAGRGGRIDVALERSDASARLTVADEGVGLPVGFDLDRDGGTGLNLVSMLAEQLGGGLEFGQARGTSISLSFPLP